MSSSLLSGWICSGFKELAIRKFQTLLSSHSHAIFLNVMYCHFSIFLILKTDQFIAAFVLQNSIIVEWEFGNCLMAYCTLLETFFFPNAQLHITMTVHTG